jgi:ribonucleotide monophosphatase NagD (HAD superfamily)
LLTTRLQYYEIVILHNALAAANCLPQNEIMVGDRLDNDIYPANILGFKTKRVLQGIAKVQIAKNKMYEPYLTINKVDDLIEYI